MSPRRTAWSAAGVALLALSALVGRRAGVLLQGSGGSVPSAPAEVLAVRVLLGGFRGVAADALWMRAAQLQDEGRYFELLTLSNWVTWLRPESEAHWAFHAWNMAYNISAVMPGEEDRWRWALNGLRLLREDALKALPRSATLHAEIAWICANRIGRPEAWNDGNRRRWAEMVESLMPGGRLAPDAGPVPRENPLHPLGLEPSRVRAVELLYGALDWRSALSHAVYWAHCGVETGGTGWPRLRCRRTLYQALAEVFFHGTAVPEEGGGWRFELHPGVLPHLLRLFEDVAAEYPDDSGVASARAVFLQEAASVLYDGGRADAAAELFERWRRAPAPAGDMSLTFEAFLAAGRETRGSPGSAPPEDGQPGGKP